ncbi:MAG TPA: hypothetical protein DCM28_05140 [Phycisphaerales bacterium]|nr:hypothetical protein [Phycisphaerales bacterium]HCD34126.1 hypothetical protein [Phycisphaerales bacterium]
MSLSRPELHELSPSELLHVHHGCMVAIQTSLAVGDDGIDEFLVRAKAVAAELHNRISPHNPIEVPDHRRKLKSGRTRARR